MKQFKVYRHIRGQALIMGLTVSLFALQMAAVIASLMLVIFSFNFVFMVGLLSFNVLLYGALAQWVKKPIHIRMQPTYPDTISTKQLSPLSHEQD